MVLGLIIFVVASVVFFGLLSRYGYDSRDGNDWIDHTHTV
jgi:hypothetical protein